MSWELGKKVGVAGVLLISLPVLLPCVVFLGFAGAVLAVPAGSVAVGVIILRRLLGYHKTPSLAWYGSQRAESPEALEPPEAPRTYENGEPAEQSHEYSSIEETGGDVEQPQEFPVHKSGDASELVEKELGAPSQREEELHSEIPTEAAPELANEHKPSDDMYGLPQREEEFQDDISMEAAPEQAVEKEPQPSDDMYALPQREAEFQDDISMEAAPEQAVEKEPQPSDDMNIPTQREAAEFQDDISTEAAPEQGMEKELRSSDDMNAPPQREEFHDEIPTEVAAEQGVEKELRASDDMNAPSQQEAEAEVQDGIAMEAAPEQGVENEPKASDDMEVELKASSDDFIVVDKQELPSDKDQSQCKTAPDYFECVEEDDGACKPEVENEKAEQMETREHTENGLKHIEPEPNENQQHTVDDEKKQKDQVDKGHVLEARSSTDEYGSLPKDFPEDKSISSSDESVNSARSSTTSEVSAKGKRRQLRKELTLLKKVVGYRGAANSSEISLSQQVEELYKFLGIELPSSYERTTDYGKLLEAVNLLKTIVGVK